MDEPNESPQSPILLTGEESNTMRLLQADLNTRAAQVRALGAELQLAKLEQEQARQLASVTVTGIIKAHGLEDGKYTAIEEGESIKLVRVES